MCVLKQICQSWRYPLLGLLAAWFAGVPWPLPAQQIVSNRWPSDNDAPHHWGRSNPTIPWGRGSVGVRVPQPEDQNPAPFQPAAIAPGSPTRHDQLAMTRIGHGTIEAWRSTIDSTRAPSEERPLTQPGSRSTFPWAPLTPGLQTRHYNPTRPQPGKAVGHRQPLIIRNDLVHGGRTLAGEGTLRAGGVVLSNPYAGPSSRPAMPTGVGVLGLNVHGLQPGASMVPWGPQHYGRGGVSTQNVPTGNSDRWADQPPTNLGSRGSGRQNPYGVRILGIRVPGESGSLDSGRSRIAPPELGRPGFGVSGPERSRFSVGSASGRGRRR